MRRARIWMVAVATAGWVISGWAAASSAAGAQAVWGPGGERAGKDSFEVRVEQVDEPVGGLRVQASGGSPFEALVLHIEGPCGPIVHPLVLDANGRWERHLGGLELDADVELRFLTRGAAGAGLQLAALVSARAREAAVGIGLHQGDLAVTEVMKDPKTVSDSQGEWFEVVNTSMSVIDIEGWTLSDQGSNFHKLSRGGLGIPVHPGQRFILGIQDDPLLNGGIKVDYRYAGFTLANGADQIFIKDAGGALVDVVAYDDGVLWPDTPGVALNLHPWKVNSYDNDDPANWCDASSPISAVNPDLGTPGGVNSMCP